MTTLTEFEIIKKAISSKLRLRIKFESGDGNIFDIHFDPYILGADTFQREFVWGLTHSLHCYKIYLDWIKMVRPEEQYFQVDPNAVYYYALEEEHYARVVAPDIKCYVYSHIAGMPMDEVATSILKSRG